MAFYFKQFLLHSVSTRTVLGTGLHDFFFFGWCFIILCMVYFFFLLKSHFNSMLEMWDWTLDVTQICACYIPAEDNAISMNN